MLTGKIYHVVYVFSNTGKLLFMVVDNSFGFAATDAQIFCQSKSTLTIHNSKVYTLGFVAHFFGNGCLIHSIHFCSSGGMNVFVLTKGFTHVFVSAEGSHYPQL